MAYNLLTVIYICSKIEMHLFQKWIYSKHPHSSNFQPPRECIVLYNFIEIYSLLLAPSPVADDGNKFMTRSVQAKI